MGKRNIEMWELRLEPNNQILLLQHANVYYCHLTYNFPNPLENEEFNCYFKTRTPWYYIIKILFFLEYGKILAFILISVPPPLLEALKAELVMSSRLRRCVIITCSLCFGDY